MNKEGFTSVFQHIHSTLVIGPEPETSNEQIKRHPINLLKPVSRKRVKEGMESSFENELLVFEGPHMVRVYILDHNLDAFFIR